MVNGINFNGDGPKYNPLKGYEPKEGKVTIDFKYKSDGKEVEPLTDEQMEGLLAKQKEDEKNLKGAKKWFENPKEFEPLTDEQIAGLLAKQKEDEEKLKKPIADEKPFLTDEQIKELLEKLNGAKEVKPLTNEQIQELFEKSHADIEKPKELQPLTNEQIKELLAKQKQDESPLNSDGTLKDGWEVNSKGEFRKKRTTMEYRFGDDDYTDGKNMRGGGVQLAIYKPEIDDYKPTYELKDGKLVPTGKVKSPVHKLS